MQSDGARPGAGARFRTAVSDDRSVLNRIRRYLLAILALGTVGAGIELLLLGHVEGIAQIAPLLLLGAAILVIVQGDRRVQAGDGEVRRQAGSRAVGALRHDQLTSGP
jgi:hypothetical protein